MTQIQAVPRLKTRRRLMLGCGVYFPHISPEAAADTVMSPDMQMPQREDPRPDRDQK